MLTRVHVIGGVWYDSGELRADLSWMRILVSGTRFISLLHTSHLAILK
jgi:hypothetical protein